MRKNVGNVERGIRLLLGLALAVVVMQRPQFGWIEAALSLASVFLVLNALSGRCYLWRWLGIDSSEEADRACEHRIIHDDASRD